MFNLLKHLETRDYSAKPTHRSKESQNDWRIKIRFVLAGQTRNSESEHGATNRYRDSRRNYTTRFDRSRDASSLSLFAPLRVQQRKKSCNAITPAFLYPRSTFVKFASRCFHDRVLFPESNTNLFFFRGEGGIFHSTRHVGGKQSTRRTGRGFKLECIHSGFQSVVRDCLSPVEPVLFVTLAATISFRFPVK